MGPHSHRTDCPYCREAQLNAAGKPRKRFTYVPLIPCLTALYKNHEMAEKMRYRSQFKHDTNITRDVMDGSHYRALCNQYVEINGQRQGHKYFSDPHDKALGLSTDGFAPFKRRKQTCWPIIVFDYDLPPEIRFLLQYIFCVGVVPGPKKPNHFFGLLFKNS